MALVGAALGVAIQNAIDGLSDEDKTNRSKLFEEMGKAIVDYIVQNAVISTTVTVTSVSGVTTGGGVSGPGTGTGTGTIS